MALAFGFGAAGFLRLGQGTLDRADQVGEIERLRQVIEGPALGGPDRRHQRVLRTHHDDRQIWPAFADAWDEIQRVLVGHHHIGDDDVAFAVAHPLPERGGIGRRAHIVAKLAQGLGEHDADGAIVIGDQDGGNHLLSSSSRR